MTEASHGVYLVQNRMWRSLGKWQGLGSSRETKFSETPSPPVESPPVRRMGSVAEITTVRHEDPLICCITSASSSSSSDVLDSLSKPSAPYLSRTVAGGRKEGEISSREACDVHDRA